MNAVTRTNLTLGIIAALLSLILILHKPALQAPTTQRLSTAAPQQASSIQLSLGNGQPPTLILQRDEQAWTLNAPVRMRADDMAVNEILRLLSVSSQRTLDPSDTDLAAIRLDPPLWQVDIDEHRFAIGGTEALSGQRYVLYQGQIHLVGDLNAARFDNNYADLVDRSLLGEHGQIQSIRLPQGEVTLVQAGSAELFARWANAEAQWLVRPSKMDFDDVRERVTVRLDSASIDFLIRSREPRLELIRPDLDLMYMLPASASRELLEP
ncbi:hypothetical protein ATO7_15667 [Oceanococcus atlanticus]|uniref:DUF4340 domain-containing protein n=1 Tax=Oceanococcus atlanticus TaxID=1317117 RepID=A0A1Y1SA75_9GAMM|nr:DUF4340 domain-containing protein [Oceanococcus atlanticus]ORE85235.1 hypothetical protein ATO7_15667 [Oceanococcus atlanticus]